MIFPDAEGFHHPISLFNDPAKSSVVNTTAKLTMLSIGYKLQIRDRLSRSAAVCDRKSPVGILGLRGEQECIPTASEIADINRITSIEIDRSCIELRFHHISAEGRHGVGDATDRACQGGLPLAIGHASNQGQSLTRATTGTDVETTLPIHDPTIEPDSLLLSVDLEGQRHIIDFSRCIGSVFDRD